MNLRSSEIARTAKQHVDGPLLALRTGATSADGGYSMTVAAREPKPRRRDRPALGACRGLGSPPTGAEALAAPTEAANTITVTNA
jgi:hypothetical protein